MADIPSTLLVDLNHTNLLQALQDLSVDGTGGVNVMGWAGTTVLLSAVGLAETADTNRLAEVDVTGDRSGADVIPVDGLWREFLVVAGLYGINPT